MRRPEEQGPPVQSVASFLKMVWKSDPGRECMRPCASLLVFRNIFGSKFQATPAKPSDLLGNAMQHVRPMGFLAYILATIPAIRAATIAAKLTASPDNAAAHNGLCRFSTDSYHDLAQTRIRHHV
jgi:hypothetical protein